MPDSNPLKPDEMVPETSSSSYAPWNPSDETEEERRRSEAEQADIASAPESIVTETINWLQSLADHYDSNKKSLLVDEMTPAEEVKILVLLARRLRTEFDDKRKEYTEKYAKHLKGPVNVIED